MTAPDPTEARVREVARNIVNALEWDWEIFLSCGLSDDGKKAARADLENDITRALLAERRAAVEEVARFVSGSNLWTGAPGHLDKELVRAIRSLAPPGGREQR